MRLRVFRVYQPLTILGLGLPELLSALAGFALGMRLGDGGHAALPFLTGAIMGFVALKLAERVRERYPGASLLQEVSWIGEADFYKPMGDKETTPLVVKEAVSQPAKQARVQG